MVKEHIMDEGNTPNSEPSAAVTVNEEDSTSKDGELAANADSEQVLGSDANLEQKDEGEEDGLQEITEPEPGDFTDDGIDEIDSSDGNPRDDGYLEIDDLTKKSYRRMQQTRSYFYGLEKRLAFLETRLKELENNPEPDFYEEPGGASDSYSVDEDECTPEIRILKWGDFNKEASRPYAVEVLEGEPVINYTFPGRGLFGLAGLRITRADSTDDERSVIDDKEGKNEDMGKENRTKTKTEAVLDVVSPLMPSELNRTTQIAEGKADGVNTLPYSFPVGTYSPEKELPERMRISSIPVLAILRSISDRFYDCKSLILFRPYKCLVHHEEELRDWLLKLEDKYKDSKEEDKNAIQATEDGEAEAEYDEQVPITETTAALNDLRCVIQFIDTFIKPKREYLMDPTRCRKVFYSDLWHLFQPGVEIVNRKGKQVYRVLQIFGVQHKGRYSNLRGHRGSVSQHSIQIKCVSLDCDGRIIGSIIEYFKITSFEGEREILSLPIYPIAYAPNAVDVRKRFIDRGKLFMELTTIKHMHFTGITLCTNEEVDSQVIIDFDQMLFNEPHQIPPITPLPAEGSSALVAEAEYSDVCNVIGCCEKNNLRRDAIYRDCEVDTERTNNYYRIHSDLALYSRSLDSIDEGHTLSDEEFLLLNNRVFGFILRNRKWASMDISDLRPVKHLAEDEGLNQLVLPPGHKDILKSLVKQHFEERKSTSFEESLNDTADVVRGKGKGLIILLHGAPGVGKTSTAECIADLYHLPLFPITCGDLGTTATDVESKLEINFNLAHRWKCVLLLDEADIFLAERTKDDFVRNSLVSVFLRVLEYYAGVLFLTTNRVGAFDEAFKSRIHISLYYKPLDLSATLAVWEMNIARTRKRKGKHFKIEEKSILKFAKTHFTRSAPYAQWNGRQIKNAFQTAIAIAEYEALQSSGAQSSGAQSLGKKGKAAKVVLKKDHFVTVASASWEFDDYLKGLHGQSFAERAFENHARFDEFGWPTRNNAFTNGRAESWGHQNSHYGQPFGPPKRSFTEEFQREAPKSRPIQPSYSNTKSQKPPITSNQGISSDSEEESSSEDEETESEAEESDSDFVRKSQRTIARPQGSAPSWGIHGKKASKGR